MHTESNTNWPKARAKTNTKATFGRKSRRIIVAVTLASGAALAIGAAVAVKNGYVLTPEFFQTAGRGLDGNHFQFHVAAEKGDIGEIRRLLKLGVDPEVRDSYRWSALMRAAAAGHADVVGLLLERGVDVNARNVQWHTALTMAGAKEKPQVVKMLFDAGASLWDACQLYKPGGSIEDRALVDAAESGNTGRMLERLAACVDVNATWAGQTALMRASSFGQVHAVRLLLKSGADVNAAGSIVGDTALGYATEQGHMSVVELLLRSGANVKARDTVGRTPLRKAVSQGHVSVTALLLKSGADVNAVDRFGDTALMDIVYYSGIPTRMPMMKLLLKSGADVNAVSHDGHTALMRAIEPFGAIRGAIKSSNYAPVVKLLLRYGANVNVRDRHGDAPLMEAALLGQSHVVELLLKSGADVNAVDRSGDTALMKALSLIGLLVGLSDTAGHVMAASSLVKAGANVNVEGHLSGSTPLMSAAEINGAVGLVKLLLEAGAEVNARDNVGLTALMCAVNRGNGPVVKLLLKAGADVHPRATVIVAADGAILSRARSEVVRSAPPRQLLQQIRETHARAEAAIAPVSLAPESAQLETHAGAEADVTALTIAEARNFIEISRILRAAGAR